MLKQNKRRHNGLVKNKLVKRFYFQSFLKNRILFSVCLFTVLIIVQYSSSGDQFIKAVKQLTSDNNPCYT